MGKRRKRPKRRTITLDRREDWWKRFAIRLIILTGSGLIFAFFFGHVWHVLTVSLPYLAERIAFEWFGWAASEATLEEISN